MAVLSLQTVLAQTKTRDSLPYQKYPTLPAFNLLMLDSQTVFNTYDIPKGKPTLLMFFSPDCDHCKMLTDSLLNHMDELKKANIYMLTPMALSAIRDFYNKMNLRAYPNITIGKDYEMFFPRYYGAYYVPFLAIYDRKKKLVRSFEGGGKMEDIIKSLQ